MKCSCCHAAMAEETCDMEKLYFCINVKCERYRIRVKNS